MNKYEFTDEIDPKTKRGRHLHTLNGEPLTGTSEVLKVIAKPLTYWAVGEGLKLLGWTPITEYIKGKPRSIKKELRLASVILPLEKITNMSNEEYLEALDQAYHAHTKTKDKAAVGGKNLHSALEKYVKFSLEKTEGVPARIESEDIQEFIDWACENVERFLWSELHTYSEEHWLGGITDCGALLKTGQTAIIDFKSSKAAYPEQFFQIGGYAIELEENGGFTSKGDRMMEPLEVSTFIIIPFGAPEFSPKIVHDENGVVRNAFLAALTLYRAQQALKI